MTDDPQIEPAETEAPADSEYVVRINPADIKGKGLTGLETALFFYLTGRQGTNGGTFVGIQRMAADLDKPKSSITRALKGLADAGLLITDGWKHETHTRVRHIVHHSTTGGTVYSTTGGTVEQYHGRYTKDQTLKDQSERSESEKIKKDPTPAPTGRKESVVDNAIASKEHTDETRSDGKTASFSNHDYRETFRTAFEEARPSRERGYQA